MDEPSPVCGRNQGVLNHGDPSAAFGRNQRRETTKSTKATKQGKKPGGHRLGPVFFALFVPFVVLLAEFLLRKQDVTAS